MSNQPGKLRHTQSCIFDINSYYLISLTRVDRMTCAPSLVNTVLLLLDWNHTASYTAWITVSVRSIMPSHPGDSTIATLLHIILLLWATVILRLSLSLCCSGGFVYCPSLDLLLLSPSHPSSQSHPRPLLSRPHYFLLNSPLPMTTSFH